MCTGLELLAAAGMAGSSVVSGIEGSSSAQINAKIASSNADTAEKQASVKRLEAKNATAKAGYDEAKLRQEVDKTLGQAKTYYASRNLDPAYGSPLLVQGLTAAQGEVDAQIVRAQGQSDRASALSEAASYDASAATSRWQAVASEQQSNLSLLSGVFGAATTLLTSASKWTGLSGGSGNSGMIDIRPAWAKL